MSVAILWIRDGVLVDRMHINPVAFAFAAWSYASPARRHKSSVADLINFGFACSGISCGDKLRLYNSQCHHLVDDIAGASSYYNSLATKAAQSAEYFAGATELMSQLQSAGAKNYITSAVEQNVLDSWLVGAQGQRCAPYLAAILGTRSDFAKGRDHFDYVYNELGHRQIYYVADAISEIKSGIQYRDRYNITTIGFASVITVEHVLHAIKLVQDAAGQLADSGPYAFECTTVDGKDIVLASQSELIGTLGGAGASYVVSGDSGNIMHNLGNYFVSQGLTSD